jgi:hypothetical protein
MTVDFRGRLRVVLKGIEDGMTKVQDNDRNRHDGLSKV